MINNCVVVRNHVHRHKISNIIDISNFKKSFLSHLNIKQFIKLNISVKEVSKKNKRHVNNELEEINIYNLNTQNKDIVEIKKNNTNNEKKTNNKISETIENINLIKPKEVTNYYLNRNHRDRLFWNMYILHHGFDEYQKINIHYGNVLLEERLQACKYIEENDLMKNMNHKITKITIQETMSELICPEKKTSFHALCALCCYYKMKIFVVNEDKKFFIEFFNTVSYNSVHVLLQLKDNYKIKYENATAEQIKNITKNKIKYQHYSKPLKGVSGYKVDELREMARTINIDSNKNKVELYQNIYKYIG